MCCILLSGSLQEAQRQANDRSRKHKNKQMMEGVEPKKKPELMMRINVNDTGTARTSLITVGYCN
jgi:hypothetical protein